MTHLLLFTATCAVVAMLRGEVFGQQGASAYDTYTSVSNVAVSLIYGVALGAALVIAVDWFRIARRHCPSPGYWMLIAMACGGLLELIVSVTVETHYSVYTRTYANYYSWHAHKLALCLGVGVVSLLCACLVGSGRWWKAVFLVPSVVLICLCPMHLLALNHIWPGWYWRPHLYAEIGVAAVLVACITWAVLLDRRRGIRHDWLHGLGVVLGLVECSAMAADGVYWLVQYA